MNLITLRAVKRLGLSIQRGHANMLGVENTTSQSNGYVLLPLEIPSIEQPHFEIFFVVNDVTRNLPFEQFNLGQYDEFSNLPLADPNFGKPGEIDALFGMNLWITILCPGVIKSKDGTIAAQQTLLGWVIYKREQSKISKKPLYVFHTVNSPENIESNEIISILEKFWRVEDIPAIKTLTPEENRCEEIFLKTHKRDSNGRYVVHLPFNEKLKLLGKSKSIAQKQFYAMEPIQNQK